MGHLLIAGDGPERTRLETRARGKPVTLAGHRPDVRSFMGAADLMVFSSEREGLSYALAEALLARLPVVSTPVPGAEELLPTCHLAPIGELKSTIADNLADPVAARERMRGVFDWASEILTVDRMVQATRRIYETGGQ
jgi:glycosyltransferase involved in cell wall biosynthesis